MRLFTHPPYLSSCAPAFPSDSGRICDSFSVRDVAGLPLISPRFNLSSFHLLSLSSDSADDPFFYMTLRVHFWSLVKVGAWRLKPTLYPLSKAPRYVSDGVVLVTLYSYYKSMTARLQLFTPTPILSFFFPPLIPLRSGGCFDRFLGLLSEFL